MALVVLRPVRLGEGEDLGAVQAAGVAEVDVLDGGRGAELGCFQAAFQPPVVPFGELAVDEQAEALLEAEPGVGGLLVLVGQGGGHGVEPQGLQSLDGGVQQHLVLLQV